MATLNQADIKMLLTKNAIEELVNQRYDDGRIKFK
jgi:hypothetical protein